jgi:hypothetical protein
LGRLKDGPRQRNLWVTDAFEWLPGSSARLTVDIDSRYNRIVTKTADVLQGTLDLLILRRLSSGVVEGLNNKAKVTMRKSYDFRTYRVLELALYHSLGKLPEPYSTHDFF